MTSATFSFGWLLECIQCTVHSICCSDKFDHTLSTWPWPLIILPHLGPGTYDWPVPVIEHINFDMSQCICIVSGLATQTCPANCNWCTLWHDNDMRPWPFMDLDHPIVDAFDPDSILMILWPGGLSYMWSISLGQIWPETTHMHWPFMTPTVPPRWLHSHFGCGGYSCCLMCGFWLSTNSMTQSEDLTNPDLDLTNPDRTLTQPWPTWQPLLEIYPLSWVISLIHGRIMNVNQYSDLDLTMTQDWLWPNHYMIGVDTVAQMRGLHSNHDHDPWLILYGFEYDFVA